VEGEGGQNTLTHLGSLLRVSRTCLCAFQDWVVNLLLKDQILKHIWLSFQTPFRNSDFSIIVFFSGTRYTYANREGHLCGKTAKMAGVILREKIVP